MGVCVRSRAEGAEVAEDRRGGAGRWGDGPEDGKMGRGRPGRQTPAAGAMADLAVAARQPVGIADPRGTSPSRGSNYSSVEGLCVQTRAERAPQAAPGQLRARIDRVSSERVLDETQGKTIYNQPWKELE